MTSLYFGSIDVGDAGASVLATALGRGVLPRLEWLSLSSAAISDAALVALAPALRRLPTLETLILWGNPLGDEGLTALVAPPPPAGAPAAAAARGLTKLKQLDLDYTQVANAGCAALAAALEGGALPALEEVGLEETPASAAAQAAVEKALPQPQVGRRTCACMTLSQIPHRPVLAPLPATGS